MAIAKGQKIEYADLISQVTSKITSICQNVDSFRNVPAQMKHGAENYRGTGGNNQLFTVTVDDNFMKESNVVPSSTVSSQLTSFLNSRGINTSYKNDKVITARDLLNFYQNIAIFIDTKIVQVKSTFTNTGVIFYDKDATPPSAANIGTDTPNNKISTANINTLLDGLQTSLSNISRMHIVNQKWTVNCSCSSSSSSSCSSSSSLFIAYMRM